MRRKESRPLKPSPSEEIEILHMVKLGRPESLARTQILISAQVITGLICDMTAVCQLYLALRPT
jgi:hypothetical protein